jgi:hypothetical protein
VATEESHEPYRTRCDELATAGQRRGTGTVPTYNGIPHYGIHHIVENPEFDPLENHAGDICILIVIWNTEICGTSPTAHLGTNDNNATMF